MNLNGFAKHLPSKIIAKRCNLNCETPVYISKNNHTSVFRIMYIDMIPNLSEPSHL